MQDLLNEEEFIITKKPYNPWRYFSIFYAVAIIQFAMLYTAGKVYGIVNDYILGVYFLAVPIVTQFLMVFIKKEITALPLKKIALAMFLLAMCYMVLILMLGLLKIEDSLTIEDLKIMGIFVIAYFVQLLFCYLIILPLLHYRKKQYS